MGKPMRQRWFVVDGDQMTYHRDQTRVRAVP
jgi:hypothetical protein